MARHYVIRRYQKIEDVLNPIPAHYSTDTEQELHKVGLSGRRDCKPRSWGERACFSSIPPPRAVCRQSSSLGGCLTDVHGVQGELLISRTWVPPDPRVDETGEHSMDVGENLGTRQHSLCCWGPSCLSSSSGFSHPHLLALAGYLNKAFSR